MVKQSEPPAAPELPVLIWDLPLRLTHWALVIAVSGAFLSSFAGPMAFSWHVYFGYAVLVLVLFRLVWGFVGPRHARFGDFVRGPRAVLGYLGRLLGGSKEAISGHNPAGGWMVLLLLVLLLLESATGLVANDAIMNVGPLYGLVDPEQSDLYTRLHHRLWDLLWIAIALHVAAVLAYLIVMRTNLISAMVTGYRRGVAAEQGIPRQLIVRALLIALVVAALVAAGIALAPSADMVPLE